IDRSRARGPAGLARRASASLLADAGGGGLVTGGGGAAAGEQVQRALAGLARLDDVAVDEEADAHGALAGVVDVVDGAADPVAVAEADRDDLEALRRADDGRRLLAASDLDVLAHDAVVRRQLVVRRLLEGGEVDRQVRAGAEALGLADGRGRGAAREGRRAGDRGQGGERGGAAD